MITMKLEIITPSTTLYSGEVKLVQLPGSTGSFEILKNHAPLVSVLTKGRIKVEDDKDQKFYFDIKGGVVEVLKNKVLVLAE
jgi:F-type H+-transporting ATPase subunit epsilon